ncbi:hypothetical protein KUV51_10820 [Tateyamaria omphalii]|uniref:hypothetical protein n=1 Tax=Tateyamaria omphalii TaxID=299262 RepID=UPI001C99AE2A|nr:hypothetical protein [Tateyamaria omphalii]MBY5933494.1 hypothetical protein [Tateyamaria omphalii]
MQGRTPGAVALLILSIALAVAGGVYWELVKGLGNAFGAPQTHSLPWSELDADHKRVIGGLFGAGGVCFALFVWVMSRRR